MNKVIEIGNGIEGTVRPLDTTSADAVLTVDEIAEELRCSKAHVYNAINGKVSGVSALRVISMGRRVLVRRSSFELWKKENASLRGSLTPLFYSSGGEVRRFPEKFDEAIRKVTGALACLGCKHSHIAGPPQTLSSDV